MRKIFMAAIISAMLAENLYAASVPDDDSAIFYPYPPQPQQAEQPAPAPKTTAPKKKPAPKKKAPVKKTPAKKSSSSSRRRPAQIRQTSLQKGIELMQQERYEKAKPYLLKAIQEERNNPNAWYWYGVYHEKTGGFYQAQYFYTKAVTIDPAFEPLSRVVFYPNDDEKTPVWDPKHPPRVYPVETASVPMNVSTFPNAPDDPEIPKVPVYVPPDPNTSPLDGDSWNPSVYVPPRPEELPEYDRTAIYMPPDADSVIADERATIDIPTRDDIITERDKVMRVDKPLYNPPEPGQRIEQPQKSQKSIKAPAKQESDSRKSSTVPEKRVVRQKKAAQTVAKVPAKNIKRQNRRTQRKSESQDVTPKTETQRPTQNRRQQNESATPNRNQRNETQTPNQQTQRQTQRQQTPNPIPTPPPVRQPEQAQPPRRQNEYLPPVGQYTPDPGTIPDRPMPPVGQGN